MAKKPAPKVTQKHVDNANEIAQVLAAMKNAQPAEAPEPPAGPSGPMPGGISPLGGQAK